MTNKIYKEKIEMRSIHFIVFILICCVFITSCEDFVDIDPPRNQVISEEVFANDETVVGAISGVYSEMTSNRDNLFNTSLEVYTGKASDEFTNHHSDITHVQFYTNDLEPSNGILFGSFWRVPYNLIGNVNVIIEQLRINASVTPSVRDQVLGEALFIRAFTHFNLTNLFGEIPYVTSSSIEITSSITRNSQSDVYESIVQDLLEAQSLMQSDFSFVDGDERIRPNRAAATALLARTYLYMEDWENAEIQATNLIDQTDTYFLEDDLNTVFLPESNEAIWQLKSVASATLQRTRQGERFIIGFFAPGNFFNVTLSESLLDAFEFDDNRLTSWVGVFTQGSNTWNYPNKYKNGVFTNINPAEYSVILRLGEQYLIRAEARAQQNDLSGSLEDVDVIRNRAGLSLLEDTNPGISQANLLLAIEQERKIELFAEFGHRWFDLKRTGRVDVVLGAIKENWQTTDTLFPIPEQEILNNPNLLPQNPGY
ncbi:RagB/SusD family nutrient uptake outer membrane protein [Fulvivirga sp. M361]|uniref:RagB/SusD family nutrient uptake outer membrane protein n=1 Tax=Fulvivirga sp. M361 TaxID=2594266 RepID=UPI00117B4052|nr:RagB/SusD family nutrient uptake outer membrane protein [Fulvivirga sp. M361]TRX61187.1 RagB/SusD family nutrient uptake outer membrane protein [Fulvivirga sp. M361]